MLESHLLLRACKRHSSVTPFCEGAEFVLSRLVTRSKINQAITEQLSTVLSAFADRQPSVAITKAASRALDVLTEL